VLSQLPGETAGYTMTPGTLHFAIDEPLPRALVEKLIAVRLRQVQDARPRRAARPAG